MAGLFKPVLTLTVECMIGTPKARLVFATPTMLSISPTFIVRFPLWLPTCLLSSQCDGTIQHCGADETVPHYIENTGTAKLRYLEMWQSDHFADISLAQWLAFTPYDLVRAHLNIDKSVLLKVSTQKTPEVGL
jgi:hypothetical protein